MKSLLITGTDTDVGKTWVSVSILKLLANHGVRVGAYKPVCSGVSDVGGKEVWHDVESLRHAINEEDVERVCPQRFQAAVAPNVAARVEGKMVDDALLSAGLTSWRTHADYVVVEGAGGLLCPLSEEAKVIDLAVRLKTPLVIVAANKLGVINHTLLTVAVARAAGLRIRAVVLNDTHEDVSDESKNSNYQQLDQWLNGTPIIKCGFGAGLDVTPEVVLDWFSDN